ncbi:EF-P 5-aminopentanol modification-associated protein YfmF [Lactobacillus sp. Sy-1]|uniref:EF-P 5-aminopentanol modification-associated protein YfmF n=1 Tax=Lactobacillus sp. Sy-1 TaxID=2109645 RepID=UPI002107C77D|nr:pitrilysin family protein [Lactobacillus sp. Sy-1]
MNGVNLNVIPTTKFKNTSITVDFIEPVNHDRFADLSIVAEMMESSNQKYPQQSLLAKQLSRLYGAGFGTDVLRYGQLHILRLVISFPNEQYLPTNESTFKMAIDFLRAVIFQPLAEAGAFNAMTFELQKQNTINYVKSIPDDKQFYSVLQLRKLYYHDDPNYSGLVYGTLDQLQAVTPQSAYQAYQEMLNHSQIQISVLGNVNEATVKDEINQIGFTSRAEHEYPVKVPVKVESEVARRVEHQDLNQSKLDLAYSLPIFYDSDQRFAALLFNAIFGGTPQSKLFRNVREKNSLAYYADSVFSSITGMLMVQTGISSEDHAKVVQIVNDQLTAIQNGDFDADTIENIKADIVNSKLAGLDSQRQLLNEQLVNNLLNQHFTTDEWCAKVKAVSKQAIVDVAKQVRLRAIYFLDGRDEDDSE